MKGGSSHRWIILTGATLLLILAMAVGYQVGQAMHTYVLSCGIWLVAAGIWLMAFKKYASRSRPPADRPVSLLSGAPEKILRKVKAARPKVFKKQMRDLESQALRMQKKTQQIDGALRSYFGGSRISYEKFASTVAGVLDVYEQRIDRILSRIEIFDEEGYEHLFKTHQEYTDAMVPYQKTFDEIDAELKENETILSQMDRLLREVSQLDQPDADLAELPAMQELSRLSDQTHLYRQNQK